MFIEPSKLDGAARTIKEWHDQLDVESRVLPMSFRPVQVEFDMTAPCRDVISIDGSYAVVWKSPSYPLWIVAVRTAMIERRYDPGKIIYNMLSNGYIDKIEVINAVKKIKEVNGIEEIMLDEDEPPMDERRIEMYVRHESTRSEEETALRIAREHSGIMIMYDGSIASGKSFQSVVTACEENNNVFIGISKDSHVKSINGIANDESILEEFSRNNPGFTGFHMVNEGQSNGVGTCFARFHQKALKWYRVDFMFKSPVPLTETLRMIACYSQVNTQPGNPFPPLTAHDVAVKVRQYKEFMETHVMKQLTTVGMMPGAIVAGLTDVNGRPLTGTFHDYLDNFTVVRRSNSSSGSIPDATR